MRRLFEDPELPAELRQDLLRSRAAGQDYPSAAKLLQLRAALSDPARQPLGDSSNVTGAVKRLASAASHPAWKLVLLAAVGGTVALGVRMAVPAQPQAAPAPQLKAAAPAQAPIQQPQPTAAREPAPEPSAVAAEPAAEPTVQPRPAASSSRREIAQLVRIRALLEQDPAAAYQLAVRSEREHPRGILSEERQALAIRALARMGNAELAQRKAREFFARYPQSPMREVIEAALRR